MPLARTHGEGPLPALCAISGTAAACSSACTQLSLAATAPRRQQEPQDPCFSGRQHAPAWAPPRTRALHSAPPRSQQAEAAADSAASLSGLAVKLADGDPFLNSDPRQEATITELQRVYEDLQERQEATSPRAASGLTLLDAAPKAAGSGRSWFSGLFGGGGGAAAESTAAAGAANSVRGLYMYGGVGVGKTFLMDLLANNPPDVELQRTHFHDFMIDVHTKLRHYQKLPDPLQYVADEIAERALLLCLDELFVTDVADAMILHRLFARLWARGLVLVATSNRHPDALYENGLQASAPSLHAATDLCLRRPWRGRNLFMPFIHRLKEACVVHDMESQTDYRRLARHHKGLYFVTLDRDQLLWERFVELANNQPIKKAYAAVAMGRQLEMPRTGGCIAYFKFGELCDRPLAAADYIALANDRHSVALEGVPVFTGASRAAAYRFVTLVDVLYEHRIRFLCSAQAMPFELFENIKTQQQAAEDRARGRSSPDEIVDDNLGFAKDRCVSRLTEMQSAEYLRAHAKAHAPELLLALAAAAAGGGSKQAPARAHA
eukprot:scaffold23.g4178.t1